MLYILFLQTITRTLYQRNTIAFIGTAETWNDRGMTHVAFSDDTVPNFLEFSAVLEEN